MIPPGNWWVSRPFLTVFLWNVKKVRFSYFEWPRSVIISVGIHFPNVPLFFLLHGFINTIIARLVAWFFTEEDGLSFVFLNNYLERLFWDLERYFWTIFFLGLYVTLQCLFDVQNFKSPASRPERTLLIVLITRRNLRHRKLYLILVVALRFWLNKIPGSALYSHFGLKSLIIQLFNLAVGRYLWIRRFSFRF